MEITATRDANLYYGNAHFFNNGYGLPGEYSVTDLSRIVWKIAVPIVENYIKHSSLAGV
jgi:hypothetical protein